MGEKINKKRIIGIVLIAVVVVTLYTYSPQTISLPIFTLSIVGAG